MLEAWKDIFERGASLEILIGVSAGAINAVGMMQFAPDFATGLEAVKRLWCTITPNDIFESKVRSVTHNLMRLVSSSRHVGNGQNNDIANAILSTAPLRSYLAGHIDMEKVHHGLSSLPGHGLAVNCFDYSYKKNITFFETLETCAEWERPSTRGMRATLTLEHIMASCAAPLIFPPVLMDGNYYGDGSLRNITPLQSAVRMGADRIINISLSGDQFQHEPHVVPTLGRIASTLFDGMFLDALDVDSEFMRRVNVLTESIPEGQRNTRNIELCRVAPMIDFSLIASHYRHRFPRTLRYLYGGWISQDMLSYLLFDGEYAKELMEYGRKDGERFRDQIEGWLRE